MSLDECNHNRLDHTRTKNKIKKKMRLLFDGQSDEREKERNDEHADQCSKVIKGMLFNEDEGRGRETNL